MKRVWLLALVMVALALVPADLLAQGCAMCKAVVENGDQGDGGNVFGGQQSIGAGLNKGILLLMVVPYVLLFLFFRNRIVGFFKEFASAQG